MLFGGHELRERADFKSLSASGISVGLIVWRLMLWQR